jgi:oxygen-independent coproporphyrinogen-3 oxidase
LKYWTRQPYFGFGVDAQSMLLSPESAEPSSSASGIEAVRFAPPDSLEKYMNGTSLQKTLISPHSALEESFFLGLRLTRGVSLREIAANFGQEAVANAQSTIGELVEHGLLLRDGESIRLTSRGQLLSNDVFERFIVADEVTH